MNLKRKGCPISIKGQEVPFMLGQDIRVTQTKDGGERAPGRGSSLPAPHSSGGMGQELQEGQWDRGTRNKAGEVGLSQITEDVRAKQVERKTRARKGSQRQSLRCVFEVQ